MTKSDFIKYIEESQGWLRRFLAGLCCGDMFLVDDLAQETYIKAFLSIESCRNKKKLKAWLLKIAYNSFLNHMRKLPAQTGIEEMSEIASDFSADSAFEYENLYDALNSLSHKERMTVILFYMEGYSTKEISVIIDSSDMNVRQILSRGRKKLKTLLK